MNRFEFILLDESKQQVLQVSSLSFFDATSSPKEPAAEQRRIAFEMSFSAPCPFR
jgi:hypothetical protein